MRPALAADVGGCEVILKGLSFLVLHSVFDTVLAECSDEISDLRGVVESDRLEIRPA